MYEVLNLEGYRIHPRVMHYQRERNNLIYIFNNLSIFKLEREAQLEVRSRVIVIKESIFLSLLEPLDYLVSLKTLLRYYKAVY